MSMLHFQFLQKLKRLPGIFHFKKNLFELLFIAFPSIFRIDPHATFVAPDEDENALQKSITPFAKGGN